MVERVRPVQLDAPPVPPPDRHPDRRTRTKIGEGGRASTPRGERRASQKDRPKRAFTKTPSSEKPTSTRKGAERSRLTRSPTP